MMQAAVFDRYGPPEVVHVTDVPRPEPRAGQVLVRVNAVAVSSGDARIRAARFPPGFALFARLVFGVFRPRRRILGSAFAGVVEALGADVAGLSPGDRVSGMTGMRLGAHAEFVVAPVKKLARTPPSVPDEDAAGVLFGGSAALFFLQDKASVGPGKSVLVNGASGAIGTNAVQLAKHFGASVTGVTSTANLGLVTQLGADRVIDYTRQDLSEIDDRFDIVFDTVGSLSIASGRRLLVPGGVLLLAVTGLWDTIRARGNVVAGPAPERPAMFEALLRMVADGELEVVHDQGYPLDEIAAAHARVDSGRKVGNIIVRP